MEEVGFCLGIMMQGAMGVIPRQVAPDIFADCIQHVASGSHWNDHQVGEWIILDWLRRSAKSSSKSNARPHFSPRETQVAALLIKLQHNKEIAAEIGITEQSIKNTLSRMFRKAGVSTREELRIHCIERGLLASPQYTEHHSPHVTSTPQASEETRYNSAAAD
jgi:DNA-binding NarL/FixJ family response regulator